MIVHDMVQDCEFCNGERHINDWRTWIKAARKYRKNLDFTLRFDEMLQVCRDLRKGFYSPIRKCIVHTEDCLCRHYIEKGGKDVLPTK